MISKEYGKYYISCDGCEQELEPAPTFGEALDRIEAEGWSTTKIGDEWVNLCKTCQEDV